MKLLFVAPGGSGGIRSQTNLLSETLIDLGSISKVFTTTSSQGLATLTSVFKIPFFIWTILYFKPDLVIFELASRGSTYRKIIFSWVLRLCRKKYIIHLHGGGYERFFGKSNKYLRKLTVSLFRNSRGVVVLAESQKELISHIAGDRLPCVAIPNGVKFVTKMNRLSKSENGPIELVFVGDVSQSKGIPELVSALRSFSTTELVLRVIGPMKLSPNEKFDFVDLVKIGQVAYLGKKERSEVIREISLADVLVLPSKVENMPLVILEAYSVGIPVLATNVGAINEMIVENETGWIIDKNPEKLVENLIDGLSLLIQSRAQLPDMSLASFDLGKRNYEITQTCRLFLSFCESVSG